MAMRIPGWLRLPRWLRRGLLVLGLLAVLLAAGAGAVWVYLHPDAQRIDGVVYGKRNGRDLTMDVFRPGNPNGRGVIFAVSGSWKSRKPGEVPVSTVAVFLRAGYTVFAVCHLSQPEASVMEIIEDMHRGVRYVRHHAGEYGVDANRLGMVGGSAGGHLSLMIATRGGKGDPQAEDLVDRESSAVQAVAIFFPVTDLLNLGPSTENLGDGGPPKSFRKAFGPDAGKMEAWKQIGRETSPIYHLHRGMPPVLIHHGDADTLTPLEQSERFRKRAAELGIEMPLVVHPGKGHGWVTMTVDLFDFVRWFDRHLGSA
ncbi:MAG: alpha/beta hydrolase [Bryobacterales bacterium]|nr:alpha/beta hydrolase [Bryobacterales bacterium]